jgi:hypothetical protein
MTTANMPIEPLKILHMTTSISTIMPAAQPLVSVTTLFTSRDEPKEHKESWVTPAPTFDDYKNKFSDIIGLLRDFHKVHRIFFKES